MKYAPKLSFTAKNGGVYNEHDGKTGKGQKEGTLRRLLLFLSVPGVIAMKKIRRPAVRGREKRRYTAAFLFQEEK